MEFYWIKLQYSQKHQKCKQATGGNNGSTGNWFLYSCILGNRCDPPYGISDSIYENMMIMLHIRKTDLKENVNIIKADTERWLALFLKTIICY